MADRTWEERGKWMDGHAAALSSSSTGPVTSYAARAVDAAMDECERLEREAAERAKAEEERSRQEWRCPVAALGRDLYGPVAALLRMCEASSARDWLTPELRTAIAQQCAIWRKKATVYNGLDAYCAALRECADDLQETMTGYVMRVLVAFDVFMNVVSGGEPDETISARVQRVANAHPRWPGWRQPGVWIALALHRLLEAIQRRHGPIARLDDAARAEAVEHVDGMDDEPFLAAGMDDEQFLAAAAEAARTPTEDGWPRLTCGAVLRLIAMAERELEADKHVDAGH